MTLTASGSNLRVRTQPMTMVRIDLNPRGGWEVNVPGKRERIVCSTLDEARHHVQRFCGQRACDAVVYDAYHRVLEHERLGISCRYR